MTRARGELPEPEEELLGIVRPSLEDEQEADRITQEKANLRRRYLLGLMQTDLFREWLMAKLNQFGTFGHDLGASPNGSPDPLASQYSMGMKAAGWQLWCEVDDLAPEMASLMRREAKGQV